VEAKFDVVGAKEAISRGWGCSNIGLRPIAFKRLGEDSQLMTISNAGNGGEGPAIMSWSREGGGIVQGE